MSTKKQNKIISLIKKHKVISIVACSLVGVLAIGGVALGMSNAQKYANSQRLLELATEQGQLSEEQIKELQENGGLAELGTEIVNPATGETVVLSKDENGNIVETVVKDSQGNPTGNTPPSSGGGYTPSPSPSPAPTPAHNHNWVAQYTTVHHDAVYQTQTTYTYQGIYRCNVCNADVTNIQPGPNSSHQCNHGYWGVYNDSIAIPHTEQVCVQNAYDEQIISGYVCQDCGAAK